MRSVLGGGTNPWPEDPERPTSVHSTPTRGLRNSPAPALLFSLEEGKPCARSEQADPATAEYATTMDSVLSVVLTMPREDELTNLRAPLKHYPRLHQPLFWPILITRLSLISQPSHTDDLGRTQISTAADAQVSSRVDRSIRSWRTLLELASSPKPRESPKHLASSLPTAPNRCCIPSSEKDLYYKARDLTGITRSVSMLIGGTPATFCSGRRAWLRKEDVWHTIKLRSACLAKSQQRPERRLCRIQLSKSLFASGSTRRES